MTQHKIFGDLLVQSLAAAGITQTELAKKLGSTQQTVSRWGRGESRPRAKEIPKLSQILDVAQEVLVQAAGYLQPETALVPFDKPLPMMGLESESFERFCGDFLARLYRAEGGRVSRMGKSGHKQDGIDLKVALSSGDHVFQCKRVMDFGPSKVRTAIGLVTPPATKRVLFLSRIASPAARKELGDSGWEIWDQDDVSRHFRLLSIQDRKELVDTFFRGQRLALLGEDDASPWYTVERFFLPYLRIGGAFNHGWDLVGRTQELASLQGALADDSILVTMLTGPGGAGKSRLLLQALEAYEGSNPVDSSDKLSQIPVEY